MKVPFKTVLLWLFLNIGIMVFMDLAMFMQTTPGMKDASFLKKLGVSEMLATLEWLFIIPANRIGNKFMSAAQVSLWSYIFDFLGQILSNVFWLKLPTTLDDLIGMVLIFIGMAISSFKLLD
jgi:uncharacterized protein (DUF486 family)